MEISTVLAKGSAPFGKATAKLLCPGTGTQR